MVILKIAESIDHGQADLLSKAKEQKYIPSPSDITKACLSFCII